MIGDIHDVGGVASHGFCIVLLLGRQENFDKLENKGAIGTFGEAFHGFPHKIKSLLQVIKTDQGVDAVPIK